ncbi:MAG: VWA domain-containing protein, partial [Acidobacteriota bacterium]|nr:VWA domain-containing protein [Acidobacteriota bacterium]
MRKISTRTIAGVTFALGASGIWLWAQEGRIPVFKSKVDLVVLSFTVTDGKGHYINGLKPGDFKVMEDGILEKISTFAEGNKQAMEVLADGTLRPLITQPGGLEPS